MDISGFGYGMSSDPGIIRWIKGRKSLVLVTYSVLQGKKGISTTSQVYAPEKFLFPPPRPPKGNKELSALRLCFFLQPEVRIPVAPGQTGFLLSLHPKKHLVDEECAQSGRVSAKRVNVELSQLCGRQSGYARRKIFHMWWNES